MSVHGDEAMRPRGRIRADVAGILIREAPATATVSVGLDVAGHRLDRDDVDELIEELKAWRAERA